MPQYEEEIPLHTLKLSDGGECGIEIGNGSFVFTASVGSSAMSLYDVNTAEKVISLDAPGEAPHQVAVSWDYVKACFATRSGKLYVWDVQFPSAMESFGLPEFSQAGSITFIKWHPRGHVVAAGTDKGFIYLWDFVVGALLYEIEAHNGPISSLAWTAHGRLLVSSGGDDCALRMWDPRNATLHSEIVYDTPHAVPSGTSIPWHSSSITCIDTLQDMSRVAISGALDGSVFLSVLKGEDGCGVFHEPPSHKNAAVSAVHFASLESLKPLRCASAGNDGIIHLFDMDRKLPMGKFKHGTDKVGQLRFNDTGDVLFSSSGSTVCAWDARVAPEEMPPIHFGGHGSKVTSFTFANHGASVVTAAEDGLLRVYDVRYPFGNAPKKPPGPVET